MAHDATLFASLADAFTYPDEGTPARLRAASSALAASHPAVADALGALAGVAREGGPVALQEVYTHTFDLNPVCALEVGWHLFGESYKRGAFLVGLREELRRYGLSEAEELPDHLPTVLRLLVAMGEAEDADLLATCVARALAVMERSLRDHAKNPYASLARATAAAFGVDLSGKGAPLHLPVVQSGVEEMEALHG